MERFLNFVSKLLFFFAIGAMALTGAVDALSGERYECVSKDNTVLVDAYFRSQDVTTDGENWYYSYKTGLEKTDMKGKRLKLNLKAIPEQLKEIGIAHIGGISYADGKIYAGMEDSKVWQHPTVGVYDAETLEFIESFELSTEVMTRGCPWVSADPERGYIYCAECKVSESLVVYDINTHELVKTLPLSHPIERIQGGEVSGDTLYVATNDATQSVWSINLISGVAVKLFDRDLLKPSEGEGLTVLATEDGAYLHTLEVGTLFINTFLRHYELPNQ